MRSTLQVGTAEHDREPLEPDARPLEALSLRRSLLELAWGGYVGHGVTAEAVRARKPTILGTASWEPAPCHTSCVLNYILDPSDEATIP